MEKEVSIERPNYSFCEYAGDFCDQELKEDLTLDVFFIYPSEPKHLAVTVSEAVRNLKEISSEDRYKSWEDLAVGGHIIFCEICKAIKSAKLIVANITTLNFNVLFELGYAIGIHKTILPIRDITMTKDKKLFDKIGIIDTLGYNNFTNSKELVKMVNEHKEFFPPINERPKIDRKQPIYYISGPIDTDGSMRLQSCLNKGYFPFRVFDVREITRLSLHEAYKQTMSSISVVAHLMDPARDGSNSHNARAAFVCGMALAAGKHVLMLQEGFTKQPIDYRDIIIPYDEPRNIDIICTTNLLD